MGKSLEDNHVNNDDVEYRRMLQMLLHGALFRRSEHRVVVFGREAWWQLKLISPSIELAALIGSTTGHSILLAFLV
ncbi:MAG TPA: hypothetical protein VMP08_22755 [Anaerolineae bacterium]|nr:hypothetical protein [Anaerolineae bacterium]